MRPPRRLVLLVVVVPAEGSTARYGAEPLLDGAQFGSARGRVAEDEQFDYEAFLTFRGGSMGFCKHRIPQ